MTVKKNSSKISKATEELGSMTRYRVSFLTGAPLKVSDYIVNPIKKVLSVEIYLPKKGGHQLKKTPCMFTDHLSKATEYQHLGLLPTMSSPGGPYLCLEGTLQWR